MGSIYKESHDFKELVWFLNGSIPAADAYHPLYQAWERCNNLIHQWLMLSFSPFIALSIDGIEDMVAIWRDLREHFSQGDLVRISKL